MAAIGEFPQSPEKKCLLAVIAVLGNDGHDIISILQYILKSLVIYRKLFCNICVSGRLRIS